MFAVKDNFHRWRLFVFGLFLFDNSGHIEAKKRNKLTQIMDADGTKEESESSDNRDPNNEQSEGAIGGFLQPSASASTGNHDSFHKKHGICA